MENVTDIYTGPCPESKYIQPFTIHYKQVGSYGSGKRNLAMRAHAKKCHQRPQRR